MRKIKYDYCKISPERDKYVVEYGHNTYKEYTLSSPIKVSDRTFSTEKSCPLCQKDRSGGVYKERREVG